MAVFLQINFGLGCPILKESVQVAHPADSRRALPHRWITCGAIPIGGGIFGQNFRIALWTNLSGFGVERGGSLIPNQDWSITQDCTGNSEPLALAAGKKNAALADNRIVTIR